MSEEPRQNGEETDGRGTNGRFKKGVKAGPGYPAGRKRSDLLRAMLQTVTPGSVEKIVARLIAIAMGELTEIQADGNAATRRVEDADSIRAAKLILDKVLPPDELKVDLNGKLKHEHDVRPLVQAMQSDAEARAAMLVVRARMRALRERN